MVHKEMKKEEYKRISREGIWKLILESSARASILLSMSFFRKNSNFLSETKDIECLIKIN